MFNSQLNAAWIQVKERQWEWQGPFFLTHVHLFRLGWQGDVLGTIMQLRAFFLAITGKRGGEEPANKDFMGYL